MHAVDLAGHPAEAAHAAAHPAHAHAACRATHAAAHVLAAVDAALAAEPAAGLEGVQARARIDRQHEVGHGVDLDHQVFLGLFLGGDQQHLVLDDVGQVEGAEHPLERRPQADTREVLGDGRVQIEPHVFEGPAVDLDRNPKLVLDRLFDVSQGRLVELPVADRLVE